jgi:hypothetical protein
MGDGSDSISCNSGATQDHQQQLQAFGDVLRKSLTTRRAKQQQNHEQRRRVALAPHVLTPRLWKNPSRKTQNDMHASPPRLSMDEEAFDEKSIATTMEMEEGGDVEMDITNGVSQSWWMPWRMLLSCFIILPTQRDNNESNDANDEAVGIDKQQSHIINPSFRWNWDGIVKFWGVMVALLVILDVGLFVAFTMQKRERSTQK